MNKSQLLLVTLLVAFCSMSYELLIARNLSQLTGEIIISQTWSVGFFILSLGLGAYSYSHWSARIRNKESFFYNLEVLLSLVGLLTVPAILIFHIFCQLNGVTYYNIKLFLFLSQIMTFLVGYLSGFEIPLILNIGKKHRFNEANTLGLHYLGSMLAGIVTAFYFTKYLSSISSVSLVASLNMIIATFLIPKGRAKIIKHFILLLIFGWSAWQLNKLELYHAKVTYFLHSPTFFAKNLTELWKLSSESINLERHQSPYQTIDIVEKLAHKEIPEASDVIRPPEYELLRRLYINGQLQVSQGYEQVYHELFAKVPNAMTGTSPQNILILGGGDGILANELLKHNSKLNITLVEIDPKMIELAKNHPALLQMNEEILNSDRVEIILDDAFSFLIRNTKLYDAIYADLPLPRDDELMRVYSTEFYLAARKSLSGFGFLVLDTPDTGDSGIESRIGDSLSDAQFPFVYHFGTNLRYALASNKLLSFDPSLIHQSLSPDSQKFLGLIEKHSHTGSAISIFRPGERKE